MKVVKEGESGERRCESESGESGESGCEAVVKVKVNENTLLH